MNLSLAQYADLLRGQISITAIYIGMKLYRPDPAKVLR